MTFVKFISIKTKGQPSITSAKSLAKSEFKRHYIVRSARMQQEVEQRSEIS